MSGDVAVDHGAAAAAMGGQSLADEEAKPARKRCKSCGQLRPTKWGKCEKCRKADGYDAVAAARASWQEEALGLRAEVHALKVEAAKPPAKLPNWLRIKRTAFNCTSSRLKEVITAIAPAADLFPMSWGTNDGADSKKWPYSFHFKEQRWDLSGAELRRALAAVEKIPELLKVDYGRRE